jgi:hypothetical protein
MSVIVLFVTVLICRTTRFNSVPYEYETKPKGFHWNGCLQEYIAVYVIDTDHCYFFCYLDDNFFNMHQSTRCCFFKITFFIFVAKKTPNLMSLSFLFEFKGSWSALNNSSCPQITVSRASSVIIVSGYGLDDRAIVVRFPAEAEDFSSNLCVQTGSGAHPVPCTMGTGDPFPGAKARPGHGSDHSPPSSAVVDNE